MSDLDPNTVRELFAAVPLFAADGDAVRGEILEQSQIIEPDKNEILFIQGAQASSLYIVLSGWVKLFRETGDGKEAITRLCTHGDLFGEAVLYNDAVYPFGAQAASEAIILRIPADIIRTRVREDGEFSTRLMREVGQRLKALELHMENLTVMTAPQRVGCFLLKLCRGKERSDINILLPYDKNLIATYLGMELATFSRTLAQLRDIGVEVDGPQVAIKDAGKLQEYVCQSCSLDIGSCHTDYLKSD